MLAVIIPSMQQLIVLFLTLSLNKLGTTLCGEVLNPGCKFGMAGFVCERLLLPMGGFIDHRRSLKRAGMDKLIAKRNTPKLCWVLEYAL